MFFLSLLLTSNGLYAIDNETIENNKIVKLIKSVWKDKRARYYQPVTVDEMQDAEGVFKKLLRDELNDEVQIQLSKLNLMMLKTADFLIISEIKPPYSGKGVFVIDRRSKYAGLLQAPHAYHDRKTGNISIKLFVENKFKALVINTVNRSSLSKNGEKVSADMAHLKNSLYIAFSRAYVSEYAHGHIVQLHGFNAKKRKATRAFDFILSNGTGTYNQQLIKQKNCIRQNLSKHSYVYPIDTRVLGGTKNSIGNTVRSMGFSGFQHIEISLPMRKRLNTSAKSRDQFSRCLLW